MCDCNSNCGCSECNREDCCPLGSVAIYDECGKFAGCVSPEEAKDYNNSKHVCAPGYAKAIDPVTGEFVGCFVPADFSSVIGDLTPDMRLVMSVSHVLCNGDSTGTASVQIIGGVAPYNIAYSGGANPAALAAGSYTVTVTDNNGLTAAQQFTIVEPDAISINATTTADTGSGDGTASANPTGGVGPYTYDWRDNGGNPIGQTTRTATGLAAGTYQVFVTDANGCVVSDTNVVVA